VSDPALLEAFVDRYFEMLERVWEDRSYAIAEKLVDGLYPSPLANRALADASRAWLESRDAQGA
jgi:aminopeptidase N